MPNSKSFRPYSFHILKILSSLIHFVFEHLSLFDFQRTISFAYRFKTSRLDHESNFTCDGVVSWASSQLPESLTCSRICWDFLATILFPAGRCHITASLPSLRLAEGAKCVSDLKNFHAKSQHFFSPVFKFTKQKISLPVFISFCSFVLSFTHYSKCIYFYCKSLYLHKTS